MSLGGYFFTTVIIVTSGLLSIGSSVENKICFYVSNQTIYYFQPKEVPTDAVEQWRKAGDICQQNNATLPIIKNHEIQKTLELYLKNISLNNDIWLGGKQRTKKEWQWSNKKLFYQPDLISSGDQNWGTQAVISINSSAGNLPSNTTLRYLAAASWNCHCICQYTASQCPAENSIQNEHHGCLKVFHDRQLNASEATKKCNNNGGYLAIFDGDEFLTKVPKVYQQMRQGYYSCYYIGLRRIDTTEWFWIRFKNEKSTMEGIYNNWNDRNNRGNGDCLFAMANNHRWEARGCTDKKHFICQRIETHAPTTKEDSSKMNEQLLVSLIGAIAGTAALITFAFIIIVLLRRHQRKANMAKSPKMSPSYVKPREVEKADSPAIYDEIQLKTTEEEDKAHQSEEATVYAEISAPPSDRNHNHSQQGVNAQSDTGVVYAAVEFAHNYN